MSVLRKSRRELLRYSTIGVATVVGAPIGASAFAASVSETTRAILDALAATLIPSDAGDPGYTELAPYGLAAELEKVAADSGEANFAVFNAFSASLLGGGNFVALSPDKRAEYLRALLDMPAPSSLEAATALGVYRSVRTTLFVLYYKNFPEVVRRDSEDIPIPSDAEHQIVNPNTAALVTGWDQAGFSGAWTWAEEEERRAELKAISAETPDDVQRWEEY